MLIKHAADIRSSEITPRNAYLNRRSFLATAGALALAGSAQATGLQYKAKAFVTDEKLTPLEHVTAYNNYYEFGTDKADPAANAGSFKASPWTVKIDGLVGKPGTYALEDMLKWADLEERIYRMRCVEGWSMVIPWVGTPLAAILNHVEPQANAKFVAFETIVRPEEMPGQSGFLQPLNWPYVEGLRLDEAMNPLTILASGLYGENLPNQNGAPLRLVVPWKYGFKGIKAIVRISLTDKQPPSTWNITNASEYGFYSNVNPEVDHPRWSQATERRIGAGGLFADPVKTLKFNGYGEQVASMYAGMDLKTEF